MTYNKLRPRLGVVVVAVDGGRGHLAPVARLLGVLVVVRREDEGAEEQRQQRVADGHARVDGDEVALPEVDAQEHRGHLADPRPVWKPNIQSDFNVSVCDSFDASSSAVLRELDESNRFVQKSAESTSI